MMSARNASPMRRLLLERLEVDLFEKVGRQGRMAEAPGDPVHHGGFEARLVEDRC